MISQPMLAVNADMDKLVFPLLATPKLDGIRCLKVDGKCVSRNFKPIPNNYVRMVVEDTCPDGFDGELIVSGNFNKVSSAIMTEAGRPKFTYHVFDYVKDDPKKPYEMRMEDLREAIPEHENVAAVLPVMVEDMQQLIGFEQIFLDAGYEGVMVRSLKGPYKMGRSTVREGYLLKIKKFEDSEAEIIGYDELLHNANEQKRDAFGLAERSSHKDNMVPAGKLGAFKVRDIKTGVEFSIGSGFDMAMREEVWQDPDSYIGRLLTYKFQPSGGKDLPRFPIFKGFRHKDDMS